MKITNQFRAGGTAANDEVDMDIKEGLECLCALHSIRRGDIPRLLGYKNSSKALRWYDRFVALIYRKDSTMIIRRHCSCSRYRHCS